jgi:cell wall-associated NlpC family hydrolase
MRAPAAIVYDDRTFLTVVGSTNGLNLRTLPSTDGDILNSMQNGSLLEVIDFGGDWHFVRYNGSFGYVSARYTRLHQPSAAGGSFAASSTINQLLETAKSFLGVRYTWGGTSPETGFDCSGFVYTTFRSIGITLNRSSRDQVRNGVHVDRANLEPGDLVFFAASPGGSRITHVGMYIGGGEFIHSSTFGVGVRISNINCNYHRPRFVAARRVI